MWETFLPFGLENDGIEEMIAVPPQRKWLAAMMDQFDTMERVTDIPTPNYGRLTLL